MKELIKNIQTLKHSDVSTLVNKRIHEFKQINRNSSDDLFKEVCFCILTANFSAERGIQIHQQLMNCFLTEPKETVAKKLKAAGYRFPNTRAAYLSESASCKEKLQTIILTQKGEELREWLVGNVKGLGYKEASHFLRNIGFDEYAIIDSHILDLLKRYHITKQLKTLTKKRYLHIEKILQNIAAQTQLTLSELDLYLWYMETGKILK